jgi:hypothetical protein
VSQEDVRPDWEEFVCDKCNYGTQQHSKSQAAEIHETAVTEDSAIGVEDAESDSIGNEQYA